MKNIEYTILKECACGPEELHILLSLVDFNDGGQIECLATAVSSLVREERIEAHLGSARRVTIDANEIVSFVSERRALGENLEDYPLNGPDYTFFTTKLGLGTLSEEDRPIEK